MKFIAFVVVVVVLAQNTSSLHLGHQMKIDLDQINERLFESTINETLECIRHVLEVGLPEYGIPSLETITIEEFNLDLETLGIAGASGYVNVNDVVLSGLTGFYASALKGTITVIPLGYTIDGTLTIPHISFNTGYDMDLIADNIIVYGKGSASMDLHDITIDIKTSIGITGGINLRELSIFINIGSANTQVTGWFNDEEHSKVVSDLVNDFLIPAWVNQQPEAISDLISPILMEIINDNLANGGGDGGEEKGIIDDILEMCAVEES